MRFIITERKGCLFYNFYKNSKVDDFYRKTNIILTNFNYTSFYLNDEIVHCVIRFERDLFFDLERAGVNGYKNIAVTSVKGSKICYDYESIDFVPKEPHKKETKSLKFENKKEYVALVFLLDSYAIKNKGLCYIEKRINSIHNSIVTRIISIKE
jgi:hypothetical protein